MDISGIDNEQFFKEIQDMVVDRLLEGVDTKQYLKEIQDRVVERMYPKFDGKNIALYKAAAIMGKNPIFVKKRIEAGEFDIGIIAKGEGEKDESYISPKKLYELTGYNSNDWDEGKEGDQYG